MNQDFEVIPEFDQNSSYSKKHNTQILKYDEFRRRYLRYIFRVIFYISILIAITIWDLISTQKAIKVIYNRQSQLQFANLVGSRVTTGYVSFVMLYMMNNTQYVEHKTPKDSLKDTILELETIQSKIPDHFLEIDKTYNPQVKSILYDNNPTCKDVNSDNLLYCQYLIGKGQPVNMLVAHSAYLAQMKQKYEAYPSASQTTMPALLAVAYQDVNTLLANFALVAAEAKIITDIMDVTLTEKIYQNRDARTVIIVIFSISLGIISLVIWIDILRVIKNVYNDFKKVLQIFPPNLILSSYLLKNFLKKTASQPLL